VAARSELAAALAEFHIWVTGHGRRNLQIQREDCQGRLLGGLVFWLRGLEVRGRDRVHWLRAEQNSGDCTCSPTTAAS